jgi:hypothetical protein
MEKPFHFNGSVLKIRALLRQCGARFTTSLRALDLYVQKKLKIRKSIGIPLLLSEISVIFNGGPLNFIRIPFILIEIPVLTVFGLLELHYFSFDFKCRFQTKSMEFE